MDDVKPIEAAHVYEWAPTAGRLIGLASGRLGGCDVCWQPGTRVVDVPIDHDGTLTIIVCDRCRTWWPECANYGLAAEDAPDEKSAVLETYRKVSGGGVPAWVCYAIAQQQRAAEPPEDREDAIEDALDDLAAALPFFGPHDLVRAREVVEEALRSRLGPDFSAPSR